MFDPLNLNRNSIVNKFAVLWIQFSFSDQQMYQFRYKLMKSVKIKKIDKRNECVIDFTNWSILNRYQSNQIYRFLSIDHSGM